MGSCFIVFLVSSVIVWNAQISALERKRDAFDPNKLMQHYMDMRTNQQSFGSFHPNDLLDAITKFFSHNKGHSEQSHDWGLYIYNPNDAMKQYLSNQGNPGSLVPETGTGSQPSSKSPNSQQKQTMFNPNDLNQKLLQSIHNGEYSGMSASQQGSTSKLQQGQHSVNSGFDPNQVNKDLMAAATTGHSLNFSTEPASGQFSPGTYSDLSLEKPGYNPDELNAGLYQTFNYDPNSVNSASLNMPGYSNVGMYSGTQFINSGNGTTEAQKQDQTTATNSHLDTDTGGSQGAGPVNGSRRMPYGSASASDRTSGSGAISESVPVRGVQTGSTLQAVLNSALPGSGSDASGQATGLFSPPGVDMNSMSGSGSSEFQAGSLGGGDIYSQRKGDVDMGTSRGMPPGIPAGTVSQTKVKPVSVSGVGTLSGGDAISASGIGSIDGSRSVR